MATEIRPFVFRKFGIVEFRLSIKIAAFCALAAVAITLALPNYYRSEIRILPVEAKLGGGLGQLASAAAAFGVGVPNQDGGDSNYIDILESRWLRESLLNSEFEFHERWFIFTEAKLRKESLLVYLKASNPDVGIGKLRPILRCSKDLKSRMLTISAETRSPELSQQIVRQAAKLLEIFLIQKGRTRGGAKASFAAARLEEARHEMAVAESAFRNFLEGSRNYQVSSDPVVRLQGGRLEAELKLKQQLVFTLSINQEQALMEEKNDMPILNVLDGGNLPIEKAGPARSLFVMATFLLGGLGTLLWLHRNRIWNTILQFDREK